MDNDPNQNNPIVPRRGRGRPKKTETSLPTMMKPEGIYHEVCYGNLELGLREIYAFKNRISDKHPDRLLGLYLLCLCDLTFYKDVQRDEVERIEAIVEHILNESGLKFPIHNEHLILPECLIFKMACQWNDWGLNYDFFYSFGTSRINFDWIQELSALNISDALVLEDILKTLQSFDNGHLQSWWFETWIGKIKTSVSIKLAKSGYFDHSMLWLRQVETHDYPSELAVAGIASAIPHLNLTNISEFFLSTLTDTSIETIKGEFKATNLNDLQNLIICSYYNLNLIQDAKNYIDSLDRVSQKNQLWSVLAHKFAERLDRQECLYCLNQRQYPSGRKFSWVDDIFWDLKVADIFLRGSRRTVGMELLENLESLSNNVIIDSDNRHLMAKLSTLYFKASEIKSSERCMERAMPPSRSRKEVFDQDEIDFDFDESIVDLSQELMAQDNPFTAILCIEEIQNNQDQKNLAYFRLAEDMAEKGCRREMQWLLDKIKPENLEFTPRRSAESLHRQFGIDGAFDCLRHPNLSILGVNALITHLTLREQYDEAVYVFKRFILEDFLTEDYVYGLSF